MKANTNQRGFAAVEAILIVIVLGIIGFTGWFVYHAKQNTDKTLTSADNNTVSQPTKKVATNTPKVVAPQYVSYGDFSKGTGIQIKTEADVAKLTGAGDKLKAYLLAHLATPCDSNNPMASCDPGEADQQYTVASTYGDFASTQAVQHYALLGPDPATGEIKELIAGQGGLTCSDLAATIAKDNIPSGLYLKDSLFSCYPTATSTSAVPYASYKS
jgi:cytoskeletal protein RodZ